jgi:solute carrier family 8 (sodium/calcium exchanger)
MPIIKHSFDVWHFIKAVTKDIFVASKLKKCVALGGWIRSIRNMLWYSFSECKGDAELLREMILSIPKHLANIHSFPENQQFKHCLHDDLPTDRSKPWLKEGSLSMRKLVLAIRGPKDCRLKDLEFMTEFQHTGINEQINSLHNVYLPKSCSFGHKQAIVRACLTAIDHNSNVDRKAALDVDGEERYNVVNTRDGQIWTAKPIMQPKNTSWRGAILAEVLEAVRSHTTPSTEIPTKEHLKRYSRKLPKPAKTVVVAATKKSRRFRDDRRKDDL